VKGSALKKKSFFQKRNFKVAAHWATVPIDFLIVGRNQTLATEINACWSDTLPPQQPLGY
tara:strand:- start:13153 stop:13332 length:180 start_codon:yes stop_codon:yes gene_type:complete